MSKTALILIWPHLADTVRSLALALAGGLSANGVKVTTVDPTRRRHQSIIVDAGPEAFSYIFSLGSPPLTIQINGSPIYDHFSAKFFFWVLDPIIYDFAHSHVRTFFERCKASDRMFFLFPDRSYQEITQDFVGNKCFYFPFAGIFPVGSTTDSAKEAQSNSRSSVIVLGNIGRELSDATQSIRDIVRQLDPFGLDAGRQSSLVEHVQNDETSSNVASAVRNFIGLESREIFQEAVVQFLNAIDSAEKRRRRWQAVASIKAQRVDFYGSGWQQYFSDCSTFNYLPGVRHDFLFDTFKRYRVLLDFAPNWDRGFNDRVITSIGAGCRVVTTRNSAISELGAAAGLVSSYSAHRPDPVTNVQAALDAPPIETELLSSIKTNHDWKIHVDRLFNDAS